ncbi:MAG: hypothetical protein U9N37_06565, partial [Thermodesulfobacteriota bacterium]|nr:hypothetical protein [Thermodesulfobacteriota bacterium]
QTPLTRQGSVFRFFSTISTGTREKYIPDPNKNHRFPKTQAFNWYLREVVLERTNKNRSTNKYSEKRISRT